MTIRWYAPAALVVLFSLGCSAQITSNLTVDGAPFNAVNCRSGVPLGFSGVELEDGDGSRLRVIAEQGSGSAVVQVFPAGAVGASTTLDSCGTIDISPQNSEINGVKNVQGEVKLSCSDGTTTIAGDLQFKNCH